jgi:hypothetical protein
VENAGPREEPPSDPPPISGSYASRVAALASTEATPVTVEPAAPVAEATAAPPPPTPVATPLPAPVSQLPAALALAELSAERAPSSPPPVTPAKKPLLASEALMEDLAPVEPLSRDARALCAAVGAAFVLFGSLPLAGLLAGGPRAALPWLVTGGFALVASVTRVAYRQRAVAMVVLGMLSGVVALQGYGGVLVKADGGAPWGFARLVAAVALPAALFFRSRYRAYAGARVFLGAALALGAPFAIHTGYALMGDFGLAQGAAVVVLLALAGSLIGFMGAETTGAGTALAPATVTLIAIELALRGLESGSALAATAGAIAFGGAAGLASIGLFQILAWRFAADARRIDLHSSKREPESRRDRDPASDWSTRE